MSVLSFAHKEGFIYGLGESASVLYLVFLRFSQICQRCLLFVDFLLPFWWFYVYKAVVFIISPLHYFNTFIIG